MKIEKKYKIIDMIIKFLKEKLITLMKMKTRVNISQVSKRISSKFIEISINSDNLHLFSIKLNQKLQVMR